MTLREIVRSATLDDAKAWDAETDQFIWAEYYVSDRLSDTHWVNKNWDYSQEQADKIAEYFYEKAVPQIEDRFLTLLERA